MICPKCKQIFSRPKNKIYKHGNQNFFHSSCPYCHYLIKEEKVYLGKYSRLLSIITLTPIFFILLLTFSFFIKDTFTFNYQELQILLILTMVLLFFITSKKTIFKYYTKIKKELQ
jgi:uncharacterized C2H2 Zn-finger protein